MDNKQFPPREGNVKRYTIDELLALMEPVYRQKKAAVEKCIAGLTAYAVGLSAEGWEANVCDLREFVTGMAQFWDLEASDQHIASFEEAISTAHNTGEAPVLTGQDKADILTGLELYAEEMRMVDPGLEEWAADCDHLAETLKGQWQAEAAQAQQTNSPQQNMEMEGM